MVSSRFAGGDRRRRRGCGRDGAEDPRRDVVDPEGRKSRPEGGLRHSAARQAPLRTGDRSRNQGRGREADLLPALPVGGGACDGGRRARRTGAQGLSRNGARPAGRGGETPRRPLQTRGGRSREPRHMPEHLHADGPAQGARYARGVGRGADRRGADPTLRFQPRGVRGRTCQGGAERESRARKVPARHEHRPGRAVCGAFHAQCALRDARRPDADRRRAARRPDLRGGERPACRHDLAGGDARARVVVRGVHGQGPFGGGGLRPDRLGEACEDRPSPSAAGSPPDRSLRRK